MKIITCFALTFAALVTTSVGAQTVVAGQASSSASCLASIPDSALTRVPVFAALTMYDPSEATVPPVAANMLQSVADRLALMLGATSGGLPKGEPGIAWDSIGRGVIITWRRDGSIAWRLTEAIDPYEAPKTKAARVVAAALDSARLAGDLFMPWPTGLSHDSVEMLIYFTQPIIDETGKLRPVNVPVAVPIFTVAAPRQQVVSIKQRLLKPHYPEEVLASGIEGKVTLQFVVDTTGRADPSTFRDLWPRGEPRLEGKEGAYYKELVESARNSVMTGRFEPARVGGCKIRQVVQQPFTWLVR